MVTYSEKIKKNCAELCQCTRLLVLTREVADFHHLTECPLSTTVTSALPCPTVRLEAERDLRVKIHFFQESQKTEKSQKLSIFFFIAYLYY